MEGQKIFINVDRVPMLIGKQGEVKKLLERKFNSTLEVDSQEGEVEIKSEDESDIFTLFQIIRAIGQGHSPEKALTLENETVIIDHIDVKSMVRNKTRLKCVMGRVIGKKGATRKVIEEITQCSVSVGDTSISVIGTFEKVILTRQALEMLILGASHKSFYNFLERNSSQRETRIL